MDVDVAAFIEELLGCFFLWPGVEGGTGDLALNASPAAVAPFARI
jgi:hypothetical protein